MEAFYILDVRGRLLKYDQRPLDTYFIRKVWEVDTEYIADLLRVASEAVLLGVPPGKAAELATVWGYRHSDCVDLCAHSRFNLRRTVKGWAVSFQTSFDTKPVTHVCKTAFESVLSHLVR